MLGKGRTNTNSKDQTWMKYEGRKETLEPSSRLASRLAVCAFLFSCDSKRYPCASIPFCFLQEEKEKDTTPMVGLSPRTQMNAALQRKSKIRQKERIAI